MASVMAIGSDFFGSYVEGTNVSVGGININISFAAGDGARYRKCFLVLYRYFGIY